MSKNDVRILGINIICAAVMLTLAESAWCALNKCTGTDGKVIYTDQPCEQNQTKTTVKITTTPPSEGQGSGSRKNRVLSPGQVAQCEYARRILESGKKEVSQERNKDKGDLLANTKQEIADLEQLIREQCN